MPYDYDHTEEVIMDATQRGAFNSFALNVWTGNPADITSATVRLQAGVNVVEVTGTKTFANENALPDPPFEVTDRTGNTYTVQITNRGALTVGGQNQLETFIATVWPGAVADVQQLDFLRVGDDMRATLFGTLTAATGGDLPSGKRFRVKTKT